MTIDLTKSTFTAEEAAELTQPSWYALDDAEPIVNMSINLPDGVYTLPSGNKENKESSWQK